MAAETAGANDLRVIACSNLALSLCQLKDLAQAKKYAYDAIKEGSQFLAKNSSEVILYILEL